jgi:phosphotransacetylase
MREVLVRYDSTLDAALPIDCIANTVCLAVSSFLYMKPLGGEYGDTPYPRSFNFGDCAAIYRPTDEVLLQIASQYLDKIPPNAYL